MGPKISIVVPIYNQEKYIKRCVDSLTNQSFTNIEIILVNDGSTDKSKEICDEICIKNRKINVIHTKNQGVSEARNTGINNSTGDYILFIDPDDTIEYDTCELLYKEALKQKNTLPICGIKLVDNNGKEIKDINFNDILDEEYFILEKKNYIKLFKSDLLNSPCNKLFKKDIIEKNNLKFNKGLALGEDMFFVMSYIEFIDTFSVINKPLYNYFQIGGGSLSVKPYKDMYEIQQNIFTKLINPLSTQVISNEDYDILEEIYNTIVWRSIRSLLRKNKEVDIKFKLKEGIRIIFSSRIISLNKNGELKKYKFNNIKVPIWYLINKIKGNI